jgi:hypothetical protein
VRHGLAAETVIGALEDAEDYKAFEAAIIADYDAQSAVERELVLRLASLLWRLRRATTMETGLFEIQANHLEDFRQARLPLVASSKLVYAPFGGPDSVSVNSDYVRNPASHEIENSIDVAAISGSNLTKSPIDPAVEIARCFCVWPTCPTLRSIA